MIRNLPLTLLTILLGSQLNVAQMVTKNVSVGQNSENDAPTTAIRLVDNDLIESGLQNFQKGVDFYKKGDYETALSFLNTAIQHIQSAQMFFYRGSVYAKLGMHEHAVLDYKNALVLDPANADYYYFIALTFNSSGQYAEAIPYWNGYISRKAGVNMAFYHRAVAYSNTGNDLQALKDLKKSVTIDHYFWNTFELLSLMLEEQGEHESAIKYISMYLEFDDKNEIAYQRRAELYQHIQEHSLANEDLEQANEIALLATID